VEIDAEAIAEAEAAAAADAEITLEAEIARAGKAAAAAHNRLEAIQQAGQALSSPERRCPLAPEILPCALSQEQLNTVLSSLHQEYNLTVQELADREKALQAATDKLTALRSSLAQSRGRARRLLLLQSELQTRKELSQNLEACLAELKTELGKLPAADDDLLNELARLEAAMVQSAEALSRCQEKEALAGRRAALELEVQNLAAAVADLEMLVKALGPDGLRQDLLSHILAGFVSRVNDRLGRLTKGAYQLSLSAGMTLLCRVSGGPLLPLPLLSRSEQLRVGIAVSEALSAAAGLLLLAVDEADMLDQENRDLLAGMLLDTAEEFDQVLVFSTVGEARPENPNLPGVKMFWVEDGRAEEIPSSCSSSPEPPAAGAEPAAQAADFGQLWPQGG
jgi:exonuclease SbcC